MSVRPSLFSQPRSARPEDLRIALQTLVDQLNRLNQGEQSESELGLADLQAQIAALQAALQDLQDFVNGLSGSGLTLQQLFELSLVTEVSNILGSVNSRVLDTVSRVEQIADAYIQRILRGVTDDASIRVEQMVSRSDRENIAQQIIVIEADLLNTNANITNEIIARVDGDAANASEINTVQTAVNSNTASITTLQTAVNGIEARWGVAINLQGQVVGLVQLDGAATGSTFTIVADKLLVAQPGVSGGDPVPVFAIANVDGVTKLALRGDMFVDGGIATRMIAAGAVTAFQIAANSITADKIQAGAVDTAAIANAAITASLLANNAVTSSAIANAAVGTSEIADASIVASKIVAGTITGDRIAANTITADRLSVANLAAISANLGTITAGLIRNSADTLRFDLPNMRIYRVDGTMDLDFLNKRFRIDF